MFKKTFCLVIIIVITFTGCSKTKDISNVVLATEINCNFDALYNNLNLKGSLIYTENSLNLVINEPDTLSGMTIKCKNDNLSVLFNDIITDYKLDQMPKTSFAFILFSALNSVYKLNGPNATQDENGFVISDQCAVGNFNFFIDKTLKPKKLVVSKSDLLINFN